MTVKKTLFEKAIQGAIIKVLENHGGELAEKKVCKLIGITPSDIPWGHNIGWARCFQVDQEFTLVLSGVINMPSAVKDQLTLDNSNEESRVVSSNIELRDKAIFQLEIFEAVMHMDPASLRSSHREWKEAAATIKEVKELLKQIN
tara:strand:- start:149 stop:583 length:435 start_codon:yes stop_codon:yes gene_type:complete